MKSPRRFTNLYGALLMCLFLPSQMPVKAQNAGHIYYIIRKSEVENGQIPLVYRDSSGNVNPLQMCYPKLKAEELTMQGGIPVFHFDRIPSSQYDSVSDCISNSTPLGRFEIDVTKRRIGDINLVVKIPYRAWNWGLSVIPYRIRFGQGSIPASAENKIDFSATFGYTRGFAAVNHERITNYHTTAGVFLGMTSASLKKATVKNLTSLDSDQTNIAASYGLALTFGRNRFGISFSLGWDTAIGPLSSQWIYQNKPWLGIGVSSSIGPF